MNITLEFIDYKTKPITPAMASKLRDGWNSYNTLELPQQQFLDTVAKIHYGPDEVYCLHRYHQVKTIAMRYSNLYVMQCQQCNKQYTTDMKT
jgi:hypothetical protein